MLVIFKPFLGQVLRGIIVTGHETSKPNLARKRLRNSLLKACGPLCLKRTLVEGFVQRRWVSSVICISSLARYNQQTWYNDMIFLCRFKLLTDETVLPGVSVLSPALGGQWQ